MTPSQVLERTSVGLIIAHSHLLCLKSDSDARLRVLATPPRGLVAALSLALAEARAPLVARMDADDVAFSGRLAAQAARLA